MRLSIPSRRSKIVHKGSHFSGHGRRFGMRDISIRRNRERREHAKYREWLRTHRMYETVAEAFIMEKK